MSIVFQLLQNHLSPRVRQTVRSELVQRQLSKEQSGKVQAGQTQTGLSQQKPVLVEQSTNHIAAHAGGAAKRTDSKENGVVKKEAEVSSSFSAQDFAHMQRVEREPNMVVMVTRDGDIVRNRGPSIMTPMMRKHSQHRGNQPVGPPPNFTPHVHRPLYPSKPHLQHPNQNVVVTSSRGPLSGGNAPVRTPNSVRHALQHHSLASAGKPTGTDPRRPSVIQHTQSNSELKNAPQHQRPQPGGNPHQIIYGPPHLALQAHGPSAGMKRQFPFQGNMAVTQFSQHVPPRAHASSHGTPSVYIRDLDPYASNLKRPPIHSSQRDMVMGMGHRAVGSANLKQRDDMPTDLSFKRGSGSPSYNSSQYNSSFTAESASAPQQDGPLNLVTHKRSHDNSSSSKSESSEPKRPYLVSQSPASICLNQSKVNADLSRVSPMQRVSPAPMRGSPHPSPGPSPRPQSAHLASPNSSASPAGRLTPQGAKVNPRIACL